MAKIKTPKPLKVILALCEGKTDVAFLRRLLAIDGYSDYKEIVENMPLPLGLKGKKTGSYFLKKLEKYEYNSKNLRDRPILPIILRRTEGQKDTFLLIYDMNGMDRVHNYSEIIIDFKNLASSPKSSDFESKKTKIDVALALLFDLDKNDVPNQLELIQEQFKEYLPEIKHLKQEKLISNTKEFKAFGCFFLGNDDQNGGNLEDVILPLMQQGKEHIFDHAKHFLNCDGEFTRFKKTKGAKEKDEYKTNSDFNKSMIGVVGQLECSALGNHDIIKSTSLLNADKFRTSEQCIEVIAFFKKLRDKVYS